MKKIIITNFLLLLLTSCAENEVTYEAVKATPKISISAIKVDETDRDYMLLKYAEIFADGGVGEAGEIPEEIAAFGRLLEKENALEYLYKLEKNANNQGKLYALCGLYYLDYDYFRSLMDTYSFSDEPVTYMFGCIISDYPINAIIKVDGAVRLDSNQDTMDAWSKRTHLSEFKTDFYGGLILDMIITILKEK